MPKKNESTSNEATKIKIEVNVYVHSDRGLVPKKDNLPEEPSMVRVGKPGGFMKAMVEHHEAMMNSKGKSMFQVAREQDEAREAQAHQERGT